MSRDWKNRKYVNADYLWAWIDEIASFIDLQMEEESVKSSETYKMLLFGRREMLQEITDKVSDEQVALEEIAELFNLKESNDE
jgi:hypothetical protein